MTCSSSPSVTWGQTSRRPLRLTMRRGAGHNIEPARIGTAGRATPVRRVMPVEGGAVVDQPDAGVPPEQVRVLRGPGRRSSRAARRDRRRSRGPVPAQPAGSKGSAPGRKSIPRFVPLLARRRSWIRRPAPPRPDRRVELDEHQLRNRQPERPRELTRDDLGHEHPWPLPAPRNLTTLAVVVCLDQPGQRPSLSQRHDIASRRD